MTTSRIIDKNFAEIFFSQIISVAGGLIAGTFLAVFTNKLLFLPGMLILLPGFLEMRGSISGTLASRISSGLFLGVIKADRPNRRIISGNIIASFFLAFCISLALGILAYFFSYFAFGIAETKIIFIAVLAALIANIVEVPLTLFATLQIFRRGHDPNNIMGPFITSTGDITSILALLIALWII